MKQTHEIALSNNYQTRTAIIVESASNNIDSQVYLSAQEKLWKDPNAELTSGERITVHMAFNNYLLIVENNHYQYQNGFLPEEHWQRSLENLACNLELPINREVVADNPYRASFEAVIQNALKEAVENPTGCWD